MKTTSLIDKAYDWGLIVVVHGYLAQRRLPATRESEAELCHGRSFWKWDRCFKGEVPELKFLEVKVRQFDMQS